MGAYCLQRLSVDGTRMQRVNMLIQDSGKKAHYAYQDLFEILSR